MKATPEASNTPVITLSLELENSPNTQPILPKTQTQVNLPKNDRRGLVTYGRREMDFGEINWSNRKEVGHNIRSAEK